jgi:hypothetical protein
MKWIVSLIENDITIVLLRYSVLFLQEGNRYISRDGKLPHSQHQWTIMVIG